MKTTRKLLGIGVLAMTFIFGSCSKESAEAAESIAFDEKEETSAMASTESHSMPTSSKGAVVLDKKSLLIDDFSSGNLTNTTFGSGTGARLYQSGSTIIGNPQGSKRMVSAKVNQNPFNQSFQIAIDNDLMAITAAFDTRGTVYVNYGNNESGLVPLGANLSDFENLKIEFTAKSTVNGLYVSLFTGTSRAVYRQHVQASEGFFVVEIPIENFEPIGPDYDISQIDYIRFQFDSRSKTGCNMAINKIWVD